MKYLFLIYDDEDLWEKTPDAEKMQVIEQHMAYSQALRDAGAFVAGDPLDHSRNAKRICGTKIEDGPYTDSKEQLGGYYMIEAADLDDAIEWAARCPGASYARIEVRPVWNIDE
jgi:hypothetical protein